MDYLFTADDAREIVSLIPQQGSISRGQVIDRVKHASSQGLFSTPLDKTLLSSETSTRLEDDGFVFTKTSITWKPTKNG